MPLAMDTGHHWRRGRILAISTPPVRARLGQKLRSGERGRSSRWPGPAQAARCGRGEIARPGRLDGLHRGRGMGTKKHHENMPKHVKTCHSLGWPGLRTPLRGSGQHPRSCQKVAKKLPAFCRNCQPADHWRAPPPPPLAPPLQGGEGRAGRRAACTPLCNSAFNAGHRSDHWRVRPSPPQTPPSQGGEGRGLSGGHTTRN